jgi:hypothetical protein
MKNWVPLLFCVLFPAVSSAQSDSLVINFKNGKHVTIALSDIRRITFDSVKSLVPQTTNSKHDLEVSPSFPNPTTIGATIDFCINSAGSVSVSIYGTKGNVIRRLIALNCSSGNNRIIWDGLDNSGKSVQNGAYFYEVRFKDEVQVRQMVVIK